MKEAYHGFYATRVYLPLSGLSRHWRRLFQRLRGRARPFLHDVSLPVVSWRDCTPRRSIRIWECEKENANVRVSELAILAALAADCEDGSNLFEIGTFDGRTTLNLALNAPADCQIFTLDLPRTAGTALPLAEGERHMVEKEAPGLRYEKYRPTFPAAVGRIHQLLGDSAALDFSPYHGSCGLVFVDGSHHYEYVLSDTRAAMKMVKRGGAVVWHDYGIWEGVTRALDFLEQREHYGLRNIRGTSLVFWRDTR